MWMPHILSCFVGVTGNIIARVMKFDEAVTRMSVADARRARFAAIPIGTIEAFPPYTVDGPRAQVTRCGVPLFRLQPGGREGYALL